MPLPDKILIRQLDLELNGDRIFACSGAENAQRVGFWMCGVKGLNRVLANYPQ